MNVLLEAIAENTRQCAEAVDLLMAQPACSFVRDLLDQVPERPGIYIIQAQDSGQCLYAGATKSRKNLRARIQGDHLTGNGESDFAVNAMQRGYASNIDEARTWISSNCTVRWLVVEDEELLGWVEHYMLGVVRPAWAS